MSYAGPEKRWANLRASYDVVVTKHMKSRYKYYYDGDGNNLMAVHGGTDLFAWQILDIQRLKSGQSNLGLPIKANRAKEAWNR